MKIAILGAGSFLASYLIPAFQGHTCFLYARQGVIPWVACLQEPFPDLIDMDVIIYCAAAGVQSNKPESVTEIWQTNLHYPSALLQHLRKFGFTGTWVSFGSYFEIGLNNEEHYMDENYFLTRAAHYPNDYCHSKAVFSRLISGLLDRNVLGFSGLHLIIPGLYGPGENPVRLFPYILHNIQNQQALQFSSGLQKRQFLHAADIAYWLPQVLITHFPSGVYHLSESQSIPVKTAIETAIQVFAPQGYTQVQIGAIETRDEKMAFLGIDDQKARQKLGWNPKIDLLSGLKSYIYTSDV